MGVKTVTKFKNAFFPVLIYWNDNRIHLNTFKKSVFVPMVPPYAKVWYRAARALRCETLYGGAFTKLIASKLPCTTFFCSTPQFTSAHYKMGDTLDYEYPLL